jgi:hypothetical protein
MARCLVKHLNLCFYHQGHIWRDGITIHTLGNFVHFECYDTDTPRHSFKKMIQEDRASIPGSNRPFPFATASVCATHPPYPTGGMFTGSKTDRA